MLALSWIFRLVTMPDPFTDTDIAQFIEAIFAIVSNQPRGLSEYELMQHLQSEGYFHFLPSPPAAPHELFQAHFLLFHALYALRDQLRQARQGDLAIHTLKIRTLPYHKGENALGETDVMREYYLDLNNLETTTAQDVNRLIELFWRKLHRQESRAQALCELGLEDPVDNETIKQAYRRLAMKHHPDRGGDSNRLQAINAAVSVLLKSV